jgi:serine protease SohB
MHYLADYGLFLAKTITFVIALLLSVAGMVSLMLKSKGQHKGQLHIKKINEKYEEMQDTLQQEILDKKHYKQWHKAAVKKHKVEEKTDITKRRLYVIYFNGDIKASAVEHLREEVTAILSVATPRDEVVVCLESYGGMVHSYGLAASQLQRIKEKNVPLTMIIDKVAASGGYLMACVGHKILAAPFAIIGSIGVIAQLPNFHRLLQKNNIDFEQITAGEYKRTLTLFGENTDKARAKMQQEIQEIHGYFKSHIQQHRPIVNIETVATGEHWLATKALELKLVDALSTSDEYLSNASQSTDIFHVSYQTKKSLSDKLSGIMQDKTSTRVDYLMQSH